MPTVPKTSDEKVVRAARRIIEQKGQDALSFALVARAVGVQAPSLYKRFADRGALLREVARGVLNDLARVQELAAVTGTPAGDLRAIAFEHRRYAHRLPRLYPLGFGAVGEAELTAEEYGAAVAVLMDRVTRLTGKPHALDGARMLVAYTHGFISMEIAGAFHLGGELDGAFRFGVERLISALEVGAPPRKPPAPPRSRG